MKNYSIERKDLEEIERLLKINTYIDKLYKKLCTLEIEGKKDTEEYKKHLEYLSILIEGENNLFKEINLTPEKALSWSKLLFQIKEKNSFDIKEDIMKQEYKNCIVSRILTTLLGIITKDYNNLTNLQNQELTNIMTMLGMKNTKNSTQKTMLINCIITKNNIEKDIYYTFLSFLQEHIEDPKQKYLQEKLIRAKYHTIYINNDIESFALINNFNIKKRAYTSSKIIIDLLQIDEKLYDNSKDLIGVTIANSEIYELLEITDIDYNNLTKVATSVLRQSMLNAALLFINDERVNEIKSELQEFTQDKEYQSIHENSNISKNLINFCFNSRNKNKHKIQTISLK